MAAQSHVKGPLDEKTLQFDSPEENFDHATKKLKNVSESKYDINHHVHENGRKSKKYSKFIKNDASNIKK